jgi:phosphoribosylformimino-5-aminoimidazole carboxamide ribotide isomerase
LQKYLKTLGVAEIVYTDIEKDGMMKGLNIEATLDLAKNVKYLLLHQVG